MQNNNDKGRFIGTVVFTILALIAFAGNSVICRLALKDQSIDPSLFTSLRLLSGALTLFVLLKLNSNTNNRSSEKGSWTSALMLFLYALTFSYAYIDMDTGTGALILFTSVQITMIIYALFTGKKMMLKDWIGIFLAFAGFVYLIMPGVTSPSLSGLILMSISGIGWGIYTIRGKKSTHPLSDTTYNFVRTIPLVLIVLLFSLEYLHFSMRGIGLALLSGGITSGIGYTIWYMALKGLTAVQAGVVQLSVPVIAAIGGVLLVGEIISFRLVIATLLILLGILMVILRGIKK